MFLKSLKSTDRRFKSLEFQEGLNLIIAERTETSQSGDSRNGTGKSSLVQILRYLFGGDARGSLTKKELSGQVFLMQLGKNSDDSATISAQRTVSGSKKMKYSIGELNYDKDVESWQKLLRDEFFCLPEQEKCPTTSQLFSQLIRTSFDDPTRLMQVDTNWVTSARLGYFLGFSPEILNQSREIYDLNKQIKAYKTAKRSGAFDALMGEDEAEIRPQIAEARSRERLLERQLRDFRVDEQYAEHQVRANELSKLIRRLNEDILLLQEEISSIERAISQELKDSQGKDFTPDLLEAYSELGIVFQDAAIKKFEEVLDFHESVVRNRKTYLSNELLRNQELLTEKEESVSKLDEERASVMRLLDSSMALETFNELEQVLAEVRVEIGDLENKLELSLTLDRLRTKSKLRVAQVSALLQAEIEERSFAIEEAMSLFRDLSEEIYTNRRSRLLISVNKETGTLDVQPKIDGDASGGINSVKIFLLDIVCLITAIKNDRTPKMLVHDGELFDSVDARQVASCLNIASRLASEYGFQYIVPINSHVLASAESEGAFSRQGYAIEPFLTDEKSDGGLFGFRFG